MRISDWSSDVCSSDLAATALCRAVLGRLAGHRVAQAPPRGAGKVAGRGPHAGQEADGPHPVAPHTGRGAPEDSKQGAGGGVTGAEQKRLRSRFPNTEPQKSESRDEIGRAAGREGGCQYG